MKPIIHPRPPNASDPSKPSNGVAATPERSSPVPLRDYYRELRAAADMTVIAHDLLGDRITSTNGSEVLADCPRHDSHSGKSLTINVREGLWYCFGCGVGGDVIHLTEHVRYGTVTKCTKGQTTQSHRDARDWLANKVGVPPLGQVHTTQEEIEAREKEEVERQSVYTALTAIAEHYNRALLGNAKMVKWLGTQYGFTRAIIERFKIGYADDSKATVAALAAQGVELQGLISTGAFRHDSYKRVQAFFEKRVVFPYVLAGQCVYMIARRTPNTPENKWEEAKYKKLPTHDPEKNPDVSKAIDNSVLYGEGVLASRPKHAVVCEGITDAIAATAAGFAVVSPATVRIKDTDRTRVVAALRFTQRVSIVLDNELSGVGLSSAIEMAHELDAAGLQCFIVTLPLRKSQTKARTALSRLVGKDTFAKLEQGPADQRKKVLDAAIASRLAHKERITQLVADAKIDVCEWFKEGTAEEFQQVLDSGRDVFDVEVEQIPGDDDPRGRSEAVDKILARLATHDAVFREQYIKAIKKKTGLTVKSLNEQLEAAGESESAVAGGSGDLRVFYDRRETGMVRVVESDQGQQVVPLTNFPAEIKTSINRDDGLTIQKALGIEATVHGRKVGVSVPSADFASMSWVIEHLGPRAVIYAGSATKDHTRVAIQVTSSPVEVTVYTATGWREIEGLGWCFIHAGGAIRPSRPERPENHIHVELPEALALYILPEPPTGDARRDAVAAVLGLLDLATARLIFVLLGAAFRVVFGATNHGVHLVGPTGVFKTEAAALFQQFFGAGMDAKHLPGSWESTANFLEMLCFAAKDALGVIDDFKPKGSTQQVHRYHSSADRVFRSQGNQNARGRMRGDRSLEVMRPPRGMTLSTGEETPAGESMRARITIVEVAEGDVVVAVLTRCQTDAAAGLYAAAMAAFLQLLADEREDWFALMKQRTEANRAAVRQRGQHRRTPMNIADLQTGVEMFLTFAHRVGALEDARVQELRAQSLDALLETAGFQHAHVLAGEPTQVFLRLLRAAIVSGEAHVASRIGEAPEAHGPESLGWTRASAAQPWSEGGKRVGWVDADDLYLELTASYKAAQLMSGDTDRLTIDSRTLSKRLSEQGLLLTEDSARKKHTVRRVLQGSERYVLHLKAAVLFHADSRADQASQAGAESTGTAASDDARPERPNRPENSSGGSEAAVPATGAAPLAPSPADPSPPTTASADAGWSAELAKSAGNSALFEGETGTEYD